LAISAAKKRCSRLVDGKACARLVLDVGAQMPSRPGDTAVERAALADGVVVRALSRLYVRARPRQGLLLGFSGYPAATIAGAAGRLAAVLQRPRLLS
jgi:DNA-binding transcriptional MocR family regulator